MILVGRCQLIANNKSRGCFFLGAATCIGVISIDTPRERAAVSCQRDANEYYIFSTLLPSGRPMLGHLARRLFITVQSNPLGLQSVLR